MADQDDQVPDPNESEGEAAPVTAAPAAATPVPESSDPGEMPAAPVDEPSPDAVPPSPPDEPRPVESETSSSEPPPAAEAPPAEDAPTMDDPSASNGGLDGIQQTAAEAHAAAVAARNGTSPAVETEVLQEVPETTSEAVSEEAPEEVEPPITYPLPFLKVLFSFKGRLNRKTYWLKGVLPSIFLGFVVHSVVAGLMMLYWGAIIFSAFSDIAGSLPGMDKAQPVDQTEFSESAGRISGTIIKETPPATITVTMSAEETTETVARKVFVGGRELQVTAKKKADSIMFDPEFQWRDYPLLLEEEEPFMSTATKLLYSAEGLIFSVVGLASYIFVAWIWLAIKVKRYHDRNQSGWWLLPLLIPVLGLLWYLWLFGALGFLKGTEGENRFGSDPLQENAA